MKKLIAMMLTGALAFSAAACGSADSQQSENSAVSESQASAETSADNAAETAAEAAETSDEAYVPSYPIVDEPITVNCVVIGQDMTNDRILFEELEKLTNIHVEFTNVEPDQLNVFLAGNEWPDFYWGILDKTVIYEYGVLGHKFADYKEYKDVMPNLWNIFEEMPLAQKFSTQSDGEIYSLPRIADSATNTQARLHYNAAFLEENNIEAPTTLDELYDVLVQCRDLNGGAAPLVQNVGGRDKITSLIYPAFGEHVLPGLYDDGTGTVQDDRVQQQYRDFLVYMNKLYADGLLHKEYLTLDSNSMLSLVQSGEAIFFSECAMSVTADMFPDGELHLGTMTPLVANEGDTPRVVAAPNVTPENYFAINAESPYVEEICRLVDIAFATEEVQEGTGLYGLAFNYGPVGMCIHLNDDGTYDLTMPDGSEGFTSDWMYKNMIYGNAGVETLGDYMTSTPGNSQERQKGYIQNVLPYANVTDFPSSYLTFSEEEQAVIDQYSTEFTSFVDEMRNKFIMGVEDINDDAAWEKYCSQMESYGMNELVAAYQTAYDRFNGN